MPTMLQNASFAAQDHVAVVQFDDPVDGRLEDQPEVFLGLADRLVRLAHAFEREVCVRQRTLLVSQCVPCLGVGLRAADLVRQDARRDAQPQHRDDRRRLHRGDPARLVQAGDGGERRARGDHGHARQDRARQVQPPFVGARVGAPGEHDHGGGEHRSGEHEDDHDPREPDVVRASRPFPAEDDDGDGDGREDEPLDDVRGGRNPEREDAERDEERGRHDRERPGRQRLPSDRRRRAG